MRWHSHFQANCAPELAHILLDSSPPRGGSVRWCRRQLTNKVSSSDVNHYLHEAAGVYLTAKDFRTWHGSVPALEFTRQACAGQTGRGATGAVIAQVAQRLGHTVAVCRKSYLHPAVLALSTALVDEQARAAALEPALAARQREGRTPARLING